MTDLAAQPAAATESVGGPADAAIAACCSLVYANPLLELLVGPSLHPGGLAGTRELLEASGIAAGDRLLDAGCGAGASARLAAGEFAVRVDAVDANQSLIERAASTGGERIRWRQEDLLALPDEAGTYDAALVECVLSILPREPALAELRRVVRRGGRLLLSDVEVKGRIPELADIGPLGAALCLGTAWGPGELDRRLPKAGFAISQRWDRSDAILRMIDGIEARARFVRIAARDLGPGLETVLPLAAVPGVDPAAFEPGALRRSAEAIRAAVRRGDVGYVAVVATAV